MPKDRRDDIPSAIDRANRRETRRDRSTD